MFMRYIEVEPLYISDEVLDMINRGEVVVRNLPGRKQSLFVPETLELKHFDPNNLLEGEMIDILRKER